jgi:hypothetical protein
MRFRIGSVLLGLILALSLSAIAVAQPADDSATPDAVPVSVPNLALAPGQTPAPRLFLLGLALFWLGLAVVRWQSLRAALLAHLAANGSAVVVGHWLDRDQF